MEKDNQKLIDDLDQALDNFDQNELNLTNQDKKDQLDQDPEMAAKIKLEYEKFMQEMKNLGAGEEGQQENIDNLTNMLGGLLKNLTIQSGMSGEENAEFNKNFEDMFKNLQQNNIEEAAGKLLSQFMDKNLLYEPLQQTKVNYENYFKNNQGKIAQNDKQRFDKQYAIVLQILTILDKEPENKAKLIQLFQKMQEYGNPPEGIASASQFM